MNLYNTLSKQAEVIKPLRDNQIGVYTCGPTVYNHVHIGNLGSFIFADVLGRVLRANSYTVRHVMNLTDVDDKTIQRSREKYAELEAMAGLERLTKECTDMFLADIRAVGVDIDKFKLVKATDNISEMQDLIRHLHEKGFAYIADDGIYFSIKAYKNAGHTYGQLSEIDTSSTSQSRINNDDYDKLTAHDFALWKTQKPGEPAWDFDIDGTNIKGRPGWHIECSAMSTINLGQPFDIHTSGVDLIFPHHENEIAQSTATGHKPYAMVFAHNEHMLVDGQKMSKSLNNFYTLEDIKERGFDPIALRVLVLQAHYRTQAHFSWDNLQAAQNRLYDLRAMAAIRWQIFKAANDDVTFAYREIPIELRDILNQDLATPQALALLSRVSAQIQAALVPPEMTDHFEAMLRGIDDLLGLDLMGVKDLSSSQKDLLQQREKARLTKDWTLADKLRGDLTKQGIGLRDTELGAIWFPQPLFHK